MAEPVVVKVGGSLLTWPGLRPRLADWLGRLGTCDVVLVPGGGAAADAVRDLDRVHGLGAEAAHWLAVRAMGLNAHVLAALLPRGRVIVGLAELPAAWAAGVTPVLDCLPVLRADEANPDRLPHTWTVTSDAIAARVAARLGRGWCCSSPPTCRRMTGRWRRGSAWWTRCFPGSWPRPHWRRLP